MAEGTDVTSLVPIIKLAPGAKITSINTSAPGVIISSERKGIDFSQQVEYTVMAEDGSIVFYEFLAQERTRANWGITIYYYPANGAGTTYPAAGSHSYDDRYLFQCQAYPNTTFYFDKWEIKRLGISTSTSTSNPLREYFSSHVELAARFNSATQYYVSTQCENPNEGEVSGSGSCPPGGYVIVSASPNSGYTFDGWYLNGSKISESELYYHYPSASCTLIAKFNSPPTISGPTLICLSCGGSTFTVANAPAGFTWDKSSNLSISGTGNTITVTPSNSGAGWLSVKLGATELVRYNLWVGKPVLIADPYNETMCRGWDNYTVSSIVMQSIGGILVNHDWWITGGTSNDYYALPDYNNFYVDWRNPGNYNIWVTADNNCGTSDPISFPIQVSYCSPAPSPAYPNPVNNVLNIKLEEPLINANTTYDVRLYNGQGNQVRQQNFKGGIVQLNVSNLPNGFYYLHILDGLNNKSSVHTIIVKH